MIGYSGASVILGLGDLGGLSGLTPPSPVGSRLVMSDLMLVLADALGVAIVLFVWAKYLRKPKSRSGRGRSSNRSSAAAPPEETEGSSEQRRERRRRRRHRRDHRPRNPTLAETGGLPPVKTVPPPNSAG